MKRLDRGATTFFSMSCDIQMSSSFSSREVKFLTDDIGVPFAKGKSESAEISLYVFELDIPDMNYLDDNIKKKKSEP